MSTNLNQKLSIIQKLDQSAPAQIANLPEVAERFQNIYTVMNGGNVGKAKVKYEAEKFHFMKLLQDKPELQQCTKLSLYGCFLDMAVNGLSFDSAMKHAYVVSFNTNTGTQQNPKWEKRAQLMISGYGELHMRVLQKQIKYADNPILVYEGDHFSTGTKDGKVFLEHIATLPRKSDNIIGCYIRLERNDDSVDYKVMSIDEVLKLKAFSKQQNSLAWTSGLPGMVQAKTIKHAFRSYPKMRMGDFSKKESDYVEDTPEVLPKIDYGLNGHMPPPAGNEFEDTEETNGEENPKMIQKTQQGAPFDEDFDKPAAPAQTKNFDDDDF